MAPRSTYAEVSEVRPHGTTLRLALRTGSIETAAAPGARLVATCRETGEEALGPAVTSAPAPGAWELDIDLEQLARDIETGKQVWDLWLALPARDGRQRRLRIGAQLHVPGPRIHFLDLPSRTVGAGGRRRRMSVYLTDRNNLSVRSDAAPTPASAAPARSSDRGPRLRKVLLRALARLDSPRPSSASTHRSGADARPTVFFLLLHAYGVGGTIRTTLSTASYLAAHGWQVEILSVLRRRDDTFFPVDDGVKVRALFDKRPGSRHSFRPSRLRRVKALAFERLEARPSVLCPPEEYAFPSMTMWTDLLLLRRMRSLPPCILVSTRPFLNLVAARCAPAHVVTVGQEHLNFEHHPEALRRRLAAEYPQLDALTVLTSADEQDYAELLGPAGPRVVRIPNALPEVGRHQSDLSEKIVVAVGRLTRQKGFDRLVNAFRLVADAHPDWELRIFGTGKDEASLQRRIDSQALGTSVRLMGRTDHVGEELAKASMYVLSSRFEGLPMVLLEAMSVGLPIVSFDCPRGPRDLVSNGANGYLVPDGDTQALAARICELIQNPGTRRCMGAAAKVRAREYAPERVGPMWEELFEQLWSARHPA